MLRADPGAMSLSFPRGRFLGEAALDGVDLLQQRDERMNTANADRAVVGKLIKQAQLEDTTAAGIVGKGGVVYRFLFFFRRCFLRALRWCFRAFLIFAGVLLVFSGMTGSGAIRA